jgi:FixJ family two-component response regulator
MAIQRSRLIGAVYEHQIRLATLTPRERQVFELVVRGKANKQNAHQLGTVARTIKAQRQHVMEKWKFNLLQNFSPLPCGLGC